MTKYVVLATTLVDSKPSYNRDLYGQRWEVELDFIWKQLDMDIYAKDSWNRP